MGTGSEADADGDGRTPFRCVMGRNGDFRGRGTRGCGEVTELELSDRNDAKALAARGDKNDAGCQVA